MIGRKERTGAEMREWLAGRTDDPGQIDRVIETLRESLALDDTRFSLAFAADKRDLAGWGAERIESTLRARGISGDLAFRAAAQEPEAEIERAVAILGERDLPVGSDRERNRALGVLLRRGYSSDHAYAAIRRMERAG